MNRLEKLEKLNALNNELGAVNEMLTSIKDKLKESDSIVETKELFEKANYYQKKGEEIIKEVLSIDNEALKGRTLVETEEDEDEPIFSLEFTPSHCKIVSNGFSKLEVLGILEEAKQQILNSKENENN